MVLKVKSSLWLWPSVLSDESYGVYVSLAFSSQGQILLVVVPSLLRDESYGS